EQVEFADGTVWNAETLDAYGVTAATADYESIWGSIRDDLIDGLGGSDSADGGTGNDRYYYNLGYGSFYLRDSGDAQDTDTLVFGDGIDPEHIRIIRSYDTLIIDLSGDDRVELDGHFSERQIERFEFADGTILSADD